ncbi:hypothetical protein GXP67_19740 [Rhodocytophaga rosea]|uniref:DNA-directed RNA polymerase n=1 Tax=Rhodocytophaga rosea TaxID=2704465 RepID=A0A6C0GL92_9BACT|nr:hypothetical protein [Rhodocytophaga rosea]QHT68717.1 hypothetical protein GXP67_19740 [Rhodocytophaga rosea]
MQTQIEHGYIDISTGKYWNAQTNKWVIKLRPSTKGTNKGAAIGKTKGYTYKKKLEAINKDATNWQTYAWLPINLSLEKLAMDAQKHWHHEVKFELDRALSLSSLIIVKRTSAIKSKKNTHFYKQGYTNVSSKALKKWVHSQNYEQYLQFFQDAKYIIRSKTYASNSYAKQIKWVNNLVFKQGDLRKYYRVPYSDERVLVRLYNLKKEKRKEILKNKSRLELTHNLELISKDFDIAGFTAWALSNPHEFKNLDELNEYLVRVQRFQAGDMYLNCMDEFGERFHSLFTNSKKIIRKFIIIDGKAPIEIDIKNSQMFFMSCLTLYKEQSYQILKKNYNTTLLYKNLHLMDYYYNSHADYKTFIDHSISGNIYQFIIKGFKEIGKIYTKKQVKDMCFKALFSKEGECKRSKKILNHLFPSVIQVCEIINRNDGGFPKLLQRFEARTLLDMIATKANEVCPFPFVTVHDSYICAPQNKELFLQLIKDTFTNLGLPIPKTNL